MCHFFYYHFLIINPTSCIGSWVITIILNINQPGCSICDINAIQYHHLVTAPVLITIFPINLPGHGTCAVIIFISNISHLGMAPVSLLLSSLFKSTTWTNHLCHYYHLISPTWISHLCQYHYHQLISTHVKTAPASIVLFNITHLDRAPVLWSWSPVAGCRMTTRLTWWWTCRTALPLALSTWWGT